MIWDEEHLIRKLRDYSDQHNKKSLGDLGIGDDAAILEIGGLRQVLCADMMVEDIHFDFNYADEDDVGYKVVTSNLSDLGAMGAVADAILCCVGSPKHRDLDRFFSGVHSACEAFDVTLVGGDISASERFTASVTALGHLNASEQPLLRSGAQIGDTIVVTGDLGASALGMRTLAGSPKRPLSLLRAPEVHHLRPKPRLREGRQALLGGVHSAIDISDGLAIDLHRLADESDVGFSLTEVPVALGADLSDALFGGEDYELLFTTDNLESLAHRFKDASLRIPIPIGEITHRSFGRTFAGQDLPKRGYVH